MSFDEPFTVDDHGNIIGPGGMFFSASSQITPGHVVLDVPLLTRLYQLGVLAGRTDIGDAGRLIDHHIAAAKNDLELDADKKLCWKCFRPRHGNSTFMDGGPQCDINSLANPNPPWVKSQ